MIRAFRIKGQKVLIVVRGVNIHVIHINIGTKFSHLSIHFVISPRARRLIGEILGKTAFSTQFQFNNMHLRLFLLDFNIVINISYIDLILSSLR